MDFVAPNDYPEAQDYGSSFPQRLLDCAIISWQTEGHLPFGGLTTSAVKLSGEWKLI